MTETAPGLGWRTRWDGRCRRGRGCELVQFLHLAWKYIRMPRENEAMAWWSLCSLYKIHSQATWQLPQAIPTPFVVSFLFSRTFSSGPLPITPHPSRGYVYVPARVRVHFIFAVWLYTLHVCKRIWMRSGPSRCAQVHHGLVAASARFMIIIGIITCVTFLGAVSPLCLLYCTDSVPRY